MTTYLTDDATEMRAADAIAPGDQHAVELAAANRRVLGRAVRDIRAGLRTSTRKDSPTIPMNGSAHSAVARLLGAGTSDIARAGTVDALRAAGLRTRTVLLADDWPTRTALPMAATTVAGAPVALLPRGGGYRIVDPAAGTSTRAGSRHSPPLRREAVAVYRSLGDTPITPRGLLSFALVGARGDLVAFLLAGLLVGTLGLVVPMSMGFLVPKVIDGGTGAFWWTGLVLGTLAVAAGLGMLVRNTAAVRLQSHIQREVEPAVWNRLLTQDVGFFRRFSTGDLVQRSNAIAQVRRLLSDVVVSSATSAVFSLVSVVLVLAVNLVLGLLLVGALALALCVLIALARRQARHESVVFDTYGEVFGVLYDILLGIDKVQAAGRELNAFARWSELFSTQKSADARALRQQSAIVAVAAALQPLAVGVLLFGVAAFGLHPDLQDIVVAGVAAAQVALSVGQFSQVATSAYGAAPVLRRLQPLLAQPAPNTGRDPGPLGGGVGLESVTFAYPGATTPTLDHVDLHAAPGEFVAVVGPSGAGKSTLVRMLLGFEEPSEGAVRFDGQDLRELERRPVRRQIGTVLQQARLMRGSLLDNIIGPSTELTESDAWAAADRAGIGAALRALPMGLQTRINETGEGLSGGQIQRIFIARALVRQPPVLLLDEATSALDNRTQREIAEQVASLACTRVVIAHRLSTVRGADRIYVLDRGRVNGVGTYDELIETNALFRRLVRSQDAQL